MKKVVSLSLAVFLLFSLAVPALADESTDGLPANAPEYSRENPAPVGTPQTFHHPSQIWDYTATLTIDSVERGDSAWERVQTHMFNNAPPEGMEYIVAHVTVSVESSLHYIRIYFSERSFTVFSSEDIYYVNELPSAIFPRELFRGSVFPGGSLSGYVAFLVCKTDEHPKVSIGSGYAGYDDEGAWFSLG